MTATTRLEKWRRRGLGNGDVTPRQMVIYRLLRHKGPLQTVQVILELCEGPVIDPKKRRGIEKDLQTLEHDGYIQYDIGMRQWWVSPRWGRIPKGG